MDHLIPGYELIPNKNFNTKIYSFLKISISPASVNRKKKYSPEFTLEVTCVTSTFLDLTKGEDCTDELRTELFLWSEALLILERGAKIPGDVPTKKHG